MSHGHITWSELLTWDVEAAKAFYAKTLGWTYQVHPGAPGEPDMPPYILPQSDTGPVMAGIWDIRNLEPAPDSPTQMPSHWFTYISVDDVDACCAAVVAAGGTVMRPPFDVPSVGRIAIIQDPTGAVVGCMTPAEHG